MKEEWKNINGYEGLYQVSNTGLIKSLERYVDHKKYGKMLVKEKITKGTFDGFYYRFKLIGLKTSTLRIHRIVATNFIDNSNNLPEVNHIDGNKLNNNLYNLEWVSKSENGKHAWNIGLQKRTYQKCSMCGLERKKGMKHGVCSKECESEYKRQWYIKNKK
jgi:hypothetical protein